MTELTINLRLNDAQHYILDDGSDEQFPLHPNYSTSVKGRGTLLPLYKLLRLRGPREFGPSEAHLRQDSNM